MAQKCLVCSHPKQNEIDALLVDGKLSINKIGKRFGLDKSCLARHRKNHLITQLAEAQQRKAVEYSQNGDNLYDRLDQRMEKLIGKLESLVERTERTGTIGQFLGAVRELRESYKLISQMRGALPTAPTINILQTSEWFSLLADVRKILQRGGYGEAFQYLISEMSGRPVAVALPKPQDELAGLVVD